MNKISVTIQLTSASEDDNNPVASRVNRARDGVTSSATIEIYDS